MSRPDETSPPVATLEAPRRRSLAWLLPVAALAVAAWLLYEARDGAGLVVQVRAAEGHGVAAGDPVRYRGIDVGRVRDVRLSAALDEVVLDVVLEPFATALAREGTAFWIARPHVALEGVAGLETLFGARYLALVPGPVDADPRRAFVALEEPPLSDRVEPGGLELVLVAPSRLGLSPGAPLLHRGVDVGSVLGVGLAADGASVELSAYVRPEFAGLVRSSTRFWEVGGAELTVGLTQGLRFDIESLRGLLVGGVAFATPDDPGEGVTNGTRFALESEPPEDALVWHPALGVGRDPDQATRAPVLFARMAWREGRFLRSDRERERSGTVTVLADELIGPADLLLVPDDPREGSLTWQLDRLERPLPGSPVRARGPLVACARPPGIRRGRDVATRALSEPEACLVVAALPERPIGLDPSRLERDGERWRVAPELVIGERWHGAAVYARTDGALVGLLVIEDENVTVAPLP